MIEKERKLMHKLADCANACNYCFTACLEEEDVKMMTHCIALCRECATICAHTIELVYYGSHFAEEQLKLCIKACQTCADECEKHDTDHNRECAKECRECVEVCRDFIKK